MRCNSCDAPICGNCKKHLRFYKERVPAAVIVRHELRSADQVTDAMCRCEEVNKNVVHVRGEEDQM